MPIYDIGGWGREKSITEKDPRSRCCWKGKVFFNNIKAMISRILYILHALLIVWRVTAVLGHYFWIFNAILLGIFVEFMYVMIKREGKEWTWFQPTIMFYFLATLPCVWLLEMEKVSTIQLKYNSSVVLLGSIMDPNLQSSDINLGTVKISADFWTLLLEQSMLVLIIISRWLMPKGDLTREQLSGLLLYYLGTASDIVDFFSVLAEDEILLLNMTFFFTIIAFWTWSMLQFIFISTMTSDVKDIDPDESSDEDEEDYDPPGYSIYDKPKSKKGKKRKFWRKMKYYIQTFIESEAWTISTSIFMQDGPFAIIRMICLFHWGITTYTNYFFTLKNILVLCLQVYRLYAVYEQHRQTRIEELKKHKVAANNWRDISKRTKALAAFESGKSRKISTTSFSSSDDSPSRKVSTSSIMPDVRKTSTVSSNRECDSLASYIKGRRFGLDHTRDMEEEQIPNVTT